MKTTVVRPTSKNKPSLIDRNRWHLQIRGAVQGVGFRPFVYRLAKELNMYGFVSNTAQGVALEVEQSEEKLTRFVERLRRELPPRASIYSLEISRLEAIGYDSFEIRESRLIGNASAVVLPDIGTCPDCLKEIFDSQNRRYHYPFTNCTNCGPRYSIIESLPYDRANTSMRKFLMCDKCQQEYDDPSDRRFHAQPNACSLCGPRLELWSRGGDIVATHDEALRAAVILLRRGEIVAVKGLGGFHLMVDARKQQSVQLLRQRKNRRGRPFAVMFPDLDQIKKQCIVSEAESTLITSVESPIVIVRKRKNKIAVVEEVAPDNPYLGVMLPYTPLHHLLLSQLDFPVVATSGNLSEEPICTDEQEALKRLQELADVFLVHNRPIVRHVDDSIVRTIADRPMVLRRARGFAPLPITVRDSLPQIASVGGHLKNTVALLIDRDIFVSQHIGDLETLEANNAFEKVLTDLGRLYNHSPEAIAHDLHPDYISTQFAAKADRRKIAVQHHYAHILGCMAENEIESPALGVAWDGTGYGIDGTIWGGEFLLIDETTFQRLKYLRTFPLVGGDSAIAEPRRSALGMLYEIYGEKLFCNERLLRSISFTDHEIHVLSKALLKKLNVVRTSSAGRIFDAVSSLLGLCHKSTYEAEAAILVEFAAESSRDQSVYPFVVDRDESGPAIDWQPMIEEIIKNRSKNVKPAIIAARFHNTLAEIIVQVAKQTNQEKVVLSGGCFQNRLLTEKVISRLRDEGFRPFWHQRIPPNDGGISLGQIIGAARIISGE